MCSGFLFVVAAWLILCGNNQNSSCGNAYNNCDNGCGNTYRNDCDCGNNYQNDSGCANDCGCGHVRVVRRCGCND